MVIFQNLSKNGEILKNVGENIKKKFCTDLFFYTQDIKNIIFNPKFYQHFLPSLIIRHSLTVSPSALLPIVGLGFGAVSTPGLCVRYVSGQNVSYPSILTIIKIICSNETILNKNVNECKKMLLELLNITR